MSDLDTSSIVELDRRHLLHPYQGFDTFRTDDVLPITRGSGARLVDNDGREYHGSAAFPYLGPYLSWGGEVGPTNETSS